MYTLFKDVPYVQSMYKRMKSILASNLGKNCHFYQISMIKSANFIITEFSAMIKPKIETKKQKSILLLLKCV